MRVFFYPGAWKTYLVFHYILGQLGLSCWKTAVNTLEFFLNPYLRTGLLILERGEEREKEGEKHWCVRETLTAFGMCPDQGPNPQSRPVPWWGMEPRYFLVFRTEPNELSHTSQGHILKIHLHILLFNLHHLLLRKLNSLKLSDLPT